MSWSECARGMVVVVMEGACLVLYNTDGDGDIVVVWNSYTSARAWAKKGGGDRVRRYIVGKTIAGIRRFKCNIWDIPILT